MKSQRRDPLKIPSKIKGTFDCSFGEQNKENFNSNIQLPKNSSKTSKKIDHICTIKEDASKRLKDIKMPKTIIQREEKTSNIQAILMSKLHLKMSDRNIDRKIIEASSKFQQNKIDLLPLSQISLYSWQAPKSSKNNELSRMER